MLTDDKVRAYTLDLLRKFDDVVVSAIRESAESPLGGIPCGTLYTVLMSTRMCAQWSAADFEHYIDGLVRSGRITHSPMHLLKAVPD